MKLFRSALLVEDEPNLAVPLQIALEKLGIPVQTVSLLAQARQLLDAQADHPPDLLILDRGLPDGDGLELCREIRSRGYSCSVLMLTAAGRVEDRIEGLNAGADDYLPKPFSWEELEARVRALARRRPPLSTDEEPSPTWRLDAARLRVLGPSGWQELTPLEYKLAERLIQLDGKIVSRDTLLREVWGFTLLPKTRTVDHFLGRLRKRFELDPEAPQHFLTVRGAGYRFTRQPKPE